MRSGCSAASSSRQASVSEFFNANQFSRAAQGSDQCSRLTARKIEQRGDHLTTNTMKIALSILLGVNACIGLLILVLSHQA